eukprot:scaffold7.g3658.t1
MFSGTPDEAVGWLPSLTAAFVNLDVDPIKTKEFVEACARVMPIFDHIGTVFMIAKHEFSHKRETLVGVSDQFTTLDAIVDAGKKGTLLLNNVQKTPKAVLPLLQRTVDTASRSSIDDDACVSPDPTARKNGEEALNQHKHAPGQLVNLLRVALEDSVDPAVRQVAAISFKNVVRQGWQAEEGAASPIPEGDKAAVREALVEGVVRAPAPVRAQLGECVRSVVYCDYPERWPGLLAQVQVNLGSQDQARVGGALLVLRLLARKYEFRDEEEREPLEALVNATFPVLLPILQALLASDSPAVERAELLKLVCKIFWSSTYMEIPAVLLREGQFAGWMGALHALVMLPVPAEGQPADPELRKGWQWWKAKKWALHIAYRLFNRYGDPKLCTEATAAAFAQRFQRDCALPLLEAALAQLARLAQQLLLSVVFPLLCFNAEDAELWRDDPQEYVRKGYDVIEDIYSTKTAAMNFLHELCKARPKGNLDMLMRHLAGVLAEYAAERQGADAALARRMDGALLAVGTLNDVLKQKRPYSGQLEPMLLQHVVPLFASPHGHLRAKAAWLAGTYADIEFADGQGRGPTFQSLLQCVIGALKDPELPVRMDAAVAVRYFLDAVEAEDLGALRPLVPELLQRFLGMSAEIDNEDLTFSLETGERGAKWASAGRRQRPPGCSPAAPRAAVSAMGCVRDWAIDYFENVLLPLDNYLLETVLSGDGYPEEQVACAPRLMGVILQHARWVREGGRGRVDHCVAPYLALVIRRLAGKPEERALGDALMLVGCDALYYNPALTLAALQQQGALGQYLSGLHSTVFAQKASGKMRHYVSPREKKVAVLGLVSLLSLAEAQLPPEVAAGMPQVVAAALRLLLALKRQQEEAEAARAESGSEASSGDGGGDSGNESDSEGGSGLGSDEDEEVDPYVFFAEALGRLQAGDPARFATLMAGVDAGAQAAVQGMMAYAAHLQQELAAKRAAEAAAAATAAPPNGRQA